MHTILSIWLNGRRRTEKTRYCQQINLRKVYGRITSGVKLINLPENEKVASIAKVRKASAEIDGEEIEISEDEEETDVPIEE